MTREGVGYRRAARARAEATVWQPAPATVDVVRYQPPEIARCRWPSCRAEVEWVETLERGLLPITHPMCVLDTRQVDGRTMTTIAAVQVHLARCPEAPAWLRQRWGVAPLEGKTHDLPAARDTHGGGDRGRRPLARASRTRRSCQRRVAR